jgi:hypothetical protein
MKIVLDIENNKMYVPNEIIMRILNFINSNSMCFCISKRFESLCDIIWLPQLSKLNHYLLLKIDKYENVRRILDYYSCIDTRSTILNNQLTRMLVYKPDIVQLIVDKNHFTYSSPSILIKAMYKCQRVTFDICMKHNSYNLDNSIYRRKIFLVTFINKKYSKLNDNQISDADYIIKSIVMDVKFSIRLLMDTRLIILSFSLDKRFDELSEKILKSYSYEISNYTITQYKNMCGNIRKEDVKKIQTIMRMYDVVDHYNQRHNIKVIISRFMNENRECINKVMRVYKL